MCNLHKLKCIYYLEKWHINCTIPFLQKVKYVTKS